MEYCKGRGGMILDMRALRAITFGKESEVAPQTKISMPLSIVIITQPVHVQLQSAIMVPHLSKKNQPCLNVIYMHKEPSPGSQFIF